ncbi:hypothetical protein VE02_03826 [Pseudogymnoascus sp. 03VT05]|nr:hypothetical protein VE02_03826 [Pseudogymnoascus sp. 03VT05]
MADRDVKPDDCLLTHIFTDNQPNSISIFLQEWDKCVFEAKFPKNPQNDYTTCVVRLESEDEKPKNFAMIAAMQRIAATIIPGLVPKTYQVGKAVNAQGRMFHFSVVELVEGDLLEDAWQLMSAGEQSSAVADLVEALQKLHSLAGILDWELAGFYPPSYELGLQDTYFCTDRHVSFYLLLKEHMKNIVPRSSSQIALVQANALIYESQQRKLSNDTNISSHIRKRVMENSKLTRDNDPYVGWTRSSQDGPPPDYSSAAFQKLVDDLVEEMLARRKLKAELNSTAQSQ